MAKITRYSGNVKSFASEATAIYRTLFGSDLQSNDLTDQITPEFLKGWEIVTASEFPTLEDFNAAFFTLGQFIAYFHQMGIPEWDTAGEQEYHAGSWVNSLGALYRCKTNVHISSTAPESDSTNWETLAEALGLAELDSPALTGTPTTATPSFTATTGKKIVNQAYFFNPTNKAGIEYSDADLLGVPDATFSSTGARIYPDGTIRGKSSYGAYTKYLDGRKEIHAKAGGLSVPVNIAHGAGYRSDTITVNLPLAISSASSVLNHNAAANAADLVSALIVAVSTTAYSIRLTSFLSTASVSTDVLVNVSE